jgi:hypothetical protein
MKDCIYIRDMVVITFYSILLLIELFCTGFIMNRIDLITNVIKYNETFISECNSDKITTFNHGSLYDNTIGLLSIISILLTMLVINKFTKFSNKNSSEYIPLININNEDNNRDNLISIYKIRLAIDIIFIMSLFATYILNITQLIFQFLDVESSCVELIDNKVNGFFTVYNILQCASIFMIISVIFIYPLYK